MALYPYRAELVVDPDNPRNVVAGGSVSIYDSEDTGKTTLLPLTDPTGTPLPNPFTSYANGLTPAFVTTSPEVLWVSGEYTDYFQSYKGMRDEAVSAVTEAQAAKLAAQLAESRTVTTAAVNGSGHLVLTKADASIVDAGAVVGPVGPTGPKGADGSNVLPTDTAIKQAIDNPASETRGALNATYVGKGSLVFNVKDYGALGNASQDDTAFIQQAIDAASVAGGEVLFPGGKYKITATLNVTKSITLRGISAGSTAETQGVTLYTALPITMFTSSANRVNFRDLNLSCYAGAGAVTATTIGIDFTDGDYCTVERCTIQNFYINIWFRSCGWWNLLNNYINNPAKYGVLVQNTGQTDTGDQVMIGNFLNCDGVNWNPDALVRQESGGGVKVTANKFYKGKVGYQIAVADGAHTSIVPTVGNSFEFQTVYCIQITQSGTGTGTFRRININANQFTSLTASATIKIDPIAGSIPIDEVVISGNVMAGTAGLTEHIVADRVGNLSITSNSFNVGLTGIKINGNAQNIHMTGNKYRQVATAVVNNTAVYYATNDLVDVEQVKTFNVTSTTTPSNLHQINIADLAGAFIDILIFGTVSGGIGGFTARLQRLATRGATGSAVTLATVGADTAGGVPVNVTFDTSTAGIVIVKIGRTGSDGGTAIIGNSVIKVRGAFSSLA